MKKFFKKIIKIYNKFFNICAELKINIQLIAQFVLKISSLSKKNHIIYIKYLLNFILDFLEAYFVLESKTLSKIFYKKKDNFFYKKFIFII